MKALHIIAWILLIIGGINWLLVGIGVEDVIGYLGTTAARVVYVLVGLAAILELVSHKKCCNCCSTSSAPSQSI